MSTHAYYERRESAGIVEYFYGARHFSDFLFLGVLNAVFLALLLHVASEGVTLRLIGTFAVFLVVFCISLSAIRGNRIIIEKEKRMLIASNGLCVRAINLAREDLAITIDLHRGDWGSEELYVRIFFGSSRAIGFPVGSYKEGDQLKEDILRAAASC